MLTRSRDKPFQRLRRQLVIMVELDQQRATAHRAGFRLDLTDDAGMTHRPDQLDAMIIPRQPTYQRGGLAIVVTVVPDDPLPIAIGLATQRQQRPQKAQPGSIGRRKYRHEWFLITLVEADR